MITPFATVHSLGRHAPPIGGGLDQHLPGGGTSLAHVIMRIAHTPASGRLEIAPDTTAGNVLARGRILGRHLRPVAFKLFRNELGKACQGTLPHLDATDPNHHRFIRPHHHPGIDLRIALRKRFPGKGNIEAQRQSSSCSSGTDEE